MTIIVDVALVSKQKTKVHNLQNYKLAQLHVKNLRQIHKELVSSVMALKPFISYKSVQRILGVIQDEIALIDAHLTQFTKVEKSKGEVKEDGSS